MKKKVYISVPMKGRPHSEIVRDIEKAVYRLKNEFATLQDFDLSFVKPTDLQQYLESVANKKGLDYYRFLTFDLEILLRECDTVALCAGWEQSQGCRLEHAAAEIYGKEIIYL